MRTNRMTMSKFYCTQCGKENIPVWRRKGREREAGHLKKLFCLNCKKEQNCCEIKSNGQYTFEMYKFEYEYGNFTKEGLRKYTYNQLKELVKNGKINKIKTLDCRGK